VLPDSYAIELMTDLEVGDRVIVLDVNSFSTPATTSSKRCVKVPDSLSFKDAVSMPCVCTTFTHSLLKAGGLEKRQTVLIYILLVVVFGCYPDLPDDWCSGMSPY
jgi:Zn-dependent alcohol dehydrogenase